MSIIKKFIIERNNLGYYYVEQIKKRKLTSFTVYYNKEKIYYSEDSFYDTFHQDKFIKLTTFTKNIKRDLISLSKTNDEALELLNKLKTFNIKTKTTLLEVLDKYNEIISINDDINFIKQYETLRKINKFDKEKKQ